MLRRTTLYCVHSQRFHCIIDRTPLLLFARVSAHKISTLPRLPNMLLELIFSSFAVFNLILLTPMLGLSPRKLRLPKKRERKAP